MTTEADEYAVLFWGCNGDSGHALWVAQREIRDFECQQHALPTRQQIDCNPMLLPQPECIGAGALTYLPSIDRSILAWWGNPWDKRPKTNNAIIVTGNFNEIECHRRFRSAFPLLSQKLPLPRVIRGGGASNNASARDWFIAGMVKELRRRGYRSDDDARTYASDLYQRTVERGEIGESDLLAGDPVKFVVDDVASWSA